MANLQSSHLVQSITTAPSPKVPSQRPPGASHVEQVHQELRGHDLDEQEHMLAPDDVEPVTRSFTTLKQDEVHTPPTSPSKLPPSGIRPRTKPAPPPPIKKPTGGGKPATLPTSPSKLPPSGIGPRTKPAPPPPIKKPSVRGQGQLPNPPTRQAPLPPGPRLTENQPIAARLAQGARAAEMIKKGVETAQGRHDEKVRARAMEVKRLEELPKKKGLMALFSKKPKLPPPIPPKDHAGAAAALEYTRGVLAHDAERAQTLRERLPPGLLGAAAGTVDRTASRIEPKVEPQHVESARDLAVGLRDGDEAMLTRLMTRKGDIERDTLQSVRLLGQNTEANVHETRYLGMAPVVYKFSKAGADVGDNDDPTLKEHATMRALEGDPHMLQAGGRTVGNRGFIMQLAKKGDLAGVGKALKQLPLVDRIDIWKHLMRGGFQALDKVHGTGRTHGDVKNENMLLGDDLEPRMMDFGTTGPEKDAGDTGTSTYMAPEIHDTNAKQATDVWSMGESLLMGVFGMNSMDFARGGNEAAPVRFKEELGKKGKLEDEKWLGHIRDKVKGLPDADVFMDFVKRVMALDPKQRLTAKQALRHDFLKLKKGQKNLGKEKLRQAMA